MTAKKSCKSCVDVGEVKMELQDILVRVTRAEEQLKHATELLTTRHTETTQALEGLGVRLGTLEQSLAKYTGFWGAIVMITSAVMTFIMLAKDFLTKKFGLGE